MQLPHLFEFMDLPWLPGSLRSTLRDILECGNSRPFRRYYDWVAEEVATTAKQERCELIVELGAGTAPVTRRLAKFFRAGEIILSPCDLNPDVPAFKELESQFPAMVQPIYTPVDFSQPKNWDRVTLAFLSATLHHVPSPVRTKVLGALAASGCRVMVFEPLNKNWQSVLFVFASLVPALLVPLWFLLRPGRLRRFVWCWLVPVAPLLFWWDGWITCLRQWSDVEWNRALQSIPRAQPAIYREGLVTHEVAF
jgi:hypothetical protein